MSLTPAIVDAVNLPVIATGGISDARTALAALMLGASAVQIGTGYLRAPEAGIATAWADAIGKAAPEDTILTRAFSGRAGRSIATKYALAMEASDAPTPAPYPVQRGLSQAMRDTGAKANNIDCIQAWAGQSAQLAQNISATMITQNLWEEMKSA
jgi:nitronate monooxygenase